MLIGRLQAPVVDETMTALDAEEFLQQQSAAMSCTADAASKRTCLCNDVILVPAASSNSSRQAKKVIILPLRSGASSKQPNVEAAQCWRITRRPRQDDARQPVL